MREDGSGDPWQRHDQIDRAALNGLVGHAENHRGGFILSDRHAPACFISSIPLAPSSPMPVMITATALGPA